jgi:prevent-host-death family protein
MSDTYSTYDAKAKLSEILRKVESGRVVRISRHGRPIAEIRPIQREPRDLETRIADLIERGQIIPPKKPSAGLKRIASRPGALARFLAERD